jgi:hypothetical protein
LYFYIDENPNCDTIEGRVFQERTPPRSVLQVLRLRGGREIWCRVTGLDPDMRPCTALARKVEDSGEGTCYLVTGGAWGLRLAEFSSAAPWSLSDAMQWGEPFLLLPSDGKDLRLVGD